MPIQGCLHTCIHICIYTIYTHHSQIHLYQLSKKATDFIVYVLPRTFYVYIQCGLIHTEACGFSNNISSSFGCWTLVLNRENFLHVKCRHRAFLAYWASIWSIGMSVCPYVYWCICISICLSVHAYICMPISAFAYPYVHWYICTSIIFLAFIHNLRAPVVIWSLFRTWVGAWDYQVL